MKQKIGLAITILVVLTAYLSLKPSFKKETREEKFSNGEQTMIKKIKKSDKEWREILTPEQYQVMRRRGTEKPFLGQYNDHYKKGIYVCAGCGTPLFSSETKYDHGTGWPREERQGPPRPSGAGQDGVFPRGGLSVESSD